jgi:hypothetical protein
MPELKPEKKDALSTSREKEASLPPKNGLTRGFKIFLVFLYVGLFALAIVFIYLAESLGWF